MATLRQQLDIAAVTQLELQKEIDVRCACFLPSSACASPDARIFTFVRNRSVGLPACQFCPHLRLQRSSDSAACRLR